MRRNTIKSCIAAIIVIGTILVPINYGVVGHIIGNEQVSTGIKCEVLKNNAAELNPSWVCAYIGLSTIETISLVENA